MIFLFEFIPCWVRFGWLWLWAKVIRAPSRWPNHHFCNFLFGIMCRRSSLSWVNNVISMICVCIDVFHEFLSEHELVQCFAKKKNQRNLRGWRTFLVTLMIMFLSKSLLTCHGFCSILISIVGHNFWFLLFLSWVENSISFEYFTN